MGRSRHHRAFRTKLTLIAAASLLAGAGLLVLSQRIVPAEDADSPAANTAPADEAPRQRTASAADNLSGLLLLFASAAFLITILCVGWIVVDIRQSRPAWKTQTRYPRRR